MISRTSAVKGIGVLDRNTKSSNHQRPNGRNQRSPNESNSISQTKLEAKIQKKYPTFIKMRLRCLNKEYFSWPKSTTNPTAQNSISSKTRIESKSNRNTGGQIFQVSIEMSDCRSIKMTVILSRLPLSSAIRVSRFAELWIHSSKLTRCARFDAMV